MHISELLTFLAALFSMMNPIGGASIFASMTADLTDEEAKVVAKKCTLAAAITLWVVIWLGDGVLAIFGINVSEIKVAGGLIVLVIGLNMLFDRHEHKSPKEEDNANSNNSIAVVPLAIPLLAGPGTMATVLVTAQHKTGMVAKMELSLVVFLICVVTGVLFTFAKPLSKKIGNNGMAVASRIMGMILMAIAVGMLSAGLLEIFPVLKG